MKKTCETCDRSEEIKPYCDPTCPYLVCETGEIVSRWSCCDEWREKTMTEQQKACVFEVEKEIQNNFGGKDFRVYASTSIVRIQYTKIDRYYRMLSIGDDYSNEKIRMKMLDLYEELRDDIKKGEKKNGERGKGRRSVL